MNDNIAGFITCPICRETHQELRINKNRILYMFCDNGCAIKLNRPKSKRYLPVLLSGSDVKDEQFGLIISAAKGKKQNEVTKQEKVHNAGFEQVHTGTTGRTTAGNDNAAASSTGNIAGSRAAAGNDNTGRSAVVGRSNGQHTNTGNDSIIGRAAKWLVADDDDDE